MNEQCQGWLEPVFVDEVISAHEPPIWQRRRWHCSAFRLGEGVCAVRLLPIRNLKPLELVLAWRSNYFRIPERIAIGIAVLFAVMNWHEEARKFCCKQTLDLSRNAFPFLTETER
jgi:hypothetical protein